MAHIDNKRTSLRHLIDSCHIPLNFADDSWDVLAVEAADRNYRGVVTTIFHPYFSWRQILQNIEKTITHSSSKYYQETTLILERTFTIPVAREYFWNRHGRLQYRSINTLSVVCKPWESFASPFFYSDRSTTGRRKYHVITAYPIRP